MSTDDFEQPTMECPRCRKEYPDFDGVGVPYCPPAEDGCGYCQHLARTGGVCEFCGDAGKDGE